MPFSASERNRVADYISASDLTIRVHSADPGTAGTTSRIGSAVATLTAANWSAGSGGAVQYDAAVALGVLDNEANQTVTYYSLWRGSTFIGSGRNGRVGGGHGRVGRSPFQPGSCE